MSQCDNTQTGTSDCFSGGAGEPPNIYNCVTKRSAAFLMSWLILDKLAAR